MIYAPLCYKLIKKLQATLSPFKLGSLAKTQPNLTFSKGAFYFLNIPAFPSPAPTQYLGTFRRVFLISRQVPPLGGSEVTDSGAVLNRRVQLHVVAKADGGADMRVLHVGCALGLTPARWLILPALWFCFCSCLESSAGSLSWTEQEGKQTISGHIPFSLAFLPTQPQDAQVRALLPLEAVVGKAIQVNQFFQFWQKCTTFVPPGELGSFRWTVFPVCSACE